MTNKIDLLFGAILVAIVVSIFSPIILTKGTIINGDFQNPVNGFDYFRSWSYLWNSFGSYNTFEYLNRLTFTITTSVFKSSEILSKLMFLSGFLLASLSMYFSIKIFFKNKIDPKNEIILQVSSFISSLFYAYNIWSFHRIGHWFLWIPYAVLPLFFISAIYSFKSSDRLKYKYIIITVLIWSFASTSPHTIVFFGLMIGGIFLTIFIFGNKKNLIGCLVLIIFLYFLINMYWIYPYVLSSTSMIISPSYIVTEEVIQMLSRDSNFLNVLRLVEDWWYPRILNIPDKDSWLYFIWLPASYMAPALSLLSIIFIRKYRSTIAFFGLMTGGIFLAMGSKAPFDIYSNIVFDIPLISSRFGWLFRDPDKWVFFVAFAYSFLMAISIFEILRYIKKSRYNKILLGCFLFLLIGSITVYSYSIYSDTMKFYNPIIIPNDFNNMNTYMSSIDTDKIFIMPISGNPLWGKGHSTGNIYQMSSTKPNIQLSSPTLNNYYNYFTISIILNKTDNINNFIYPLGTSYLIYHNDMADPNLLYKLYSLDRIKNIGNVGFFEIFKTEGDSRQINVIKQNIALIGGIDRFTTINFLDNFNSINSSIFFLDQSMTKDKYDYTKNMDYLIFDNNQKDFILSFIDEKYLVKPFYAVFHHNPKEVWSKASTNDPLHGPWHRYIENRDIDNWDFDYEKGIIFTWLSVNNKDTNIPKYIKPVVIDMDLNVDNGDEYKLFVRYFKNEDGGKINISIDNITKSINTQDQLNKFVWSQVATLNLKKGKYKLTLTNVEGFNAVNVFALISKKEYEKLQEKIYTLLEGKRLIYIFEAESDLYRNNITISKKANASNGKVIEFKKVSAVWQNVSILRDDNYTMALKLNGTINVQIGQEKYNISSNTTDFKYIGPIYLNKGNRRIMISSNVNNSDLDVIWIYSTNNKGENVEDIFTINEVSAKVINYYKVDPTLYKIQINAPKPFMMSFAESYDPLWIANIDKIDGNNIKPEEIRSVPLYSVVNGFWINQTGNLDISVRYKPQEWFEIGLVISIIAYICCIGYLLYDLRRKRNERE